jgi:hypothetical protein
MADELLIKAEQTPLTRKKLLKRAGVGAGALALGTVPMIAASPAWAQSGTVTRCLEKARAGGPPCGNACGGTFSTCSADGCCFCVILTSGCCDCIDFCRGSFASCAKNRDCPGREKCVDAPCAGGGLCVPRCTSAAGAGAASPDARLPR